MDFEKLYYYLKNEIVKKNEECENFTLGNQFILGEKCCCAYLLAFCDSLERKTEVLKYGN